MAVAAIAAIAAVLVGSVPGTAFAQETDDEGGTRSLREKLDAAAGKYQDAKGALEKSEERELDLVLELEDLEKKRKRLVKEVQHTAAAAYRSGRNSSSPDTFLERVVTIEVIAQRENDSLTELKQVTEDLERRQGQIAEEIAIQQKEVKKLREAKDEAEQALFAIGGGSSGSFEPFPAEDAEPAPRNQDGWLPSESCSEPDPTTSGCLSPRMLHAYEEARLFGFTRYTSCFRNGDFGEHPTGRACDFAAQVSGFGGAAQGTDKAYGDRLASFFVHNADALGVQYVIWYREIYIGGSWSTYSGVCGDPSCDHTNHVHVSVR
jgi:hypothetical protein